jgi:hypothetical protein
MVWPAKHANQANFNPQHAKLKVLVGPASKPAVTAIVALGAVLAYLGFGIQKRLYRGRALGIAAYCVVVILGGVVVLGATSL